MCFPKSPPPAVPLPQQNRKTPITIISVWDQNVDSEFAAIRSLITDFPNVSMDTEYPGVVDTTPAWRTAPRTVNGRPILEPADAYEMIKMNVDSLNLIQIGLTLTDDEGNLPERGGPGGGCCCIWQFNFRDFDSNRDRHARASIELLRESGIDFDRNREFGIDTARFAELIMSSGLVCSDSVSWVTFHGTYDFGYLVKALTQRPLPGELGEFLNLLRIFFGPRVYDLKHVMKFCPNLRGGLERLSRSLNVERLAGQSHQAGSDSLLTWHAFQRLRDLHFSETGLEKYAGVLYGLDMS